MSQTKVWDGNSMIGETAGIKAERLAENASTELARAFSEALELKVELDPMTGKNYETNVHKILVAAKLNAETYTCESSGLRGFEIEHQEGLTNRGTIVITLGWAAPAFNVIELAKELSDQGYRILITDLPGFGLNRLATPQNMHEWNEKLGGYLRNYYKRIKSDKGENHPVILSPLSLSNPSILQFLLQQSKDSEPADPIGDSAYLMMPAIALGAESQLKKLLGRNRWYLDAVFASAERLMGNSQILARYTNLGRALSNSASMLKGEEGMHTQLANTMRQFYLFQSLPLATSIARLKNKGLLLGAIFGSQDEAINHEVTRQILNPLEETLTIVDGAPHSLECSKSGDGTSNLKANLPKVLQTLNKYSEARLRVS